MKVADDLYVIQNANHTVAEIGQNGGNVTVIVTSDGVILVDSKFERMHDDIMAKVKSVTDRPVRYMVLTPQPRRPLGRLGTAASRWASRWCRRWRRARTWRAPTHRAARRWPTAGYSELMLGGTRLELREFRGHTRGDTVVSLPARRAVIAGDLVTTPDSIPAIVNYADGGNWTELGESLDAIARMDFDVLIGGHGPNLTKAEFLKFRDKAAGIRERFRALNREQEDAGRDRAGPDQGIQLGHRPRRRQSRRHDAGAALMYGAKAVRPLARSPRRPLRACASSAQARGARATGASRRTAAHRRRRPPRWPTSPGQWVSLVTEDWRYRMFTAPKGDTVSLPLNPAGQKAAAALGSGQGRSRRRAVQGVRRGGHHADADAAAHHVAGRHHAEDRNRRRHADAAAAIRRRGAASPAAGRACRWRRGTTRARRSRRAGSARAPAPAPPPGGSMKVVTTQMRPGYLRRNGVPYSANAVMTEYFDRLEVPGGDTLLRRRRGDRRSGVPADAVLDEHAVQAADRCERLESDAVRGPLTETRR